MHVASHHMNIRLPRTKVLSWIHRFILFVIFHLAGNITTFITLGEFPKLKVARAGFIVRWFNAEPKLFESLINKSGSINKLRSNELNNIYLKMVDIIKTFNISSTESTNPDQNTSSDETEPRNLDNNEITIQLWKK